MTDAKTIANKYGIDYKVAEDIANVANNKANSTIKKYANKFMGDGYFTIRVHFDERGYLGKFRGSCIFSFRNDHSCYGVTGNGQELVHNVEA